MATVTTGSYRADQFSTVREWLYFCVEFDLEICDCCQRRARRRRGSATDDDAWRCSDCPAPIHRDLWTAVSERRSVTTDCDLCGERVALRDGWISADARRVYCQRHRQPITPADRLRFTAEHLAQTVSERGEPGAGTPGAGAPATDQIAARITQLRQHLASSDCDRCAFNGHGIYSGSRLLEVDRSEGRCDCAPDALNCAGMEG